MPPNDGVDERRRPNILYSHHTDWQTRSRANARTWLYHLLGFGCAIFVVLVAVGRLTKATYMQDGLWMIFLVSVVVFAPVVLALYDLVRSALKW